MNQDKNAATVLRARKLNKSYFFDHSSLSVLHDIDLDIRRGEFVAVMGPSGCGKSTLLHILGLMQTANNAEELMLEGVDTMSLNQSQRTAVRRERIGFVFQRFNLLDILSAEDNLRLAFKIRGAQASDAQIKEVLATVGLSERSRHKPQQMSIGEQQRLAIARAMIHRPAILLADEPTGNLDSENTARIMDLLVSYNKEYGQTIIMVTHNPELVGRVDRLVKMKDGRIVE
ncbi:MAG: ABC transporter ATP-binding protein [Phycisphaerae bacterium]|nr:ABC transporter ATP-binding protein [Phycisphaerae bacterium]